jgi:hypothetical protein
MAQLQRQRRVTTYLTTGDMSRLKQTAEKAGLTVSHVVRIYILDSLPDDTSRLRD